MTTKNIRTSKILTYLLRERDKIVKKEEANMAEVSYVTEQDFQDEVLNSSLPVMVDFTAVWCGPCKMVDPIVKQLAGEWDGKVKVLKCDADQNPNVLMQYGIMGIPTIMLFKGGKMVERVTGYQPKDKLASKMGAHI
jgi:thioredoxin 1